jgi:hypothetical protein
VGGGAGPHPPTPNPQSPYFSFKKLFQKNNYMLLIN